jgi:hypothetical protein
MIEQAQDWLDAQRAEQRELLLIVDRLAEPDPIVRLFGADLMQDYVNLYQESEVADLADVGPWLAHVQDYDAPVLQELLEAPEQHWGWLASAPQIDMVTLAEHWRARMLIEENGERSLYRLQDSRVIAHHLNGLDERQRPLLLGPLTSALCWDGNTWQAFDNPQPKPCPAPFDTPWLALPEPEAVARNILRHNLERWLWENHPAATTRLAENEPLEEWLDRQLAKAESWQWDSSESLQFLLRYRLESKLQDHPAWSPLNGETPEAHYVRCSQELKSLMEFSA